MSDEAPRLHRRKLLRAGLGGALLLGAGSALAIYHVGYDVAPATRARLKALTPKEFIVAEAIAVRMMRHDEPDMPQPEALSPGLFIDAMVARMDAATATDLCRLLHVVEHVLPAQLREGVRFSALPGDAQDRVLAAMMTHRVGLLRGAFDALKSLAALAFFSDPRTWPAIGYDGPLVGRGASP